MILLTFEHNRQRVFTLGEGRRKMDGEMDGEMNGEVDVEMNR
jgi:hypothetical protein